MAIPNPAPPIPPRPLLRVVTYNIRHARGMDDRVDLRRIAGVLQAIDADVICLQEIEAGMPRSRRTRQAAWLGEMLGMQARFGPALGFWPLPRFGNAILTKHKSYSTWNKPLPSRGEPRRLLKTTIDWQGRPVHILCSHFGLNAAYRLRQAQTVADAARRLAGEDGQAAVIVCGDFNAPAHSPETALLREAGKLSAGEAGEEAILTFPSSHPDVQIDFVLAGGAARVVKLKAMRTPASDHLPLAAEVELKNPSVMPVGMPPSP